jgi:hypothetical protein
MRRCPRDRNHRYRERPGDAVCLNTRRECRRGRGAETHLPHRGQHPNLCREMGHKRIGEGREKCLEGHGIIRVRIFVRDRGIRMDAV